MTTPIERWGLEEFRGCQPGVHGQAQSTTFEKGEEKIAFYPGVTLSMMQISGKA